MTRLIQLTSQGWYAIVCRTNAEVRPSREPFRETLDLYRERLRPYLYRCRCREQAITAPDPIIVGPYPTREAARAADMHGPNPISLFQGIPLWLLNKRVPTADQN